MLRDKLNERFESLAGQYQRINWRDTSSGSGSYAPEGEWRKWATSVANLLVACGGNRSPHGEAFADRLAKCAGYSYELDGLWGVFLSAKEDFQGGYMIDMELQVSGEVFSDFVVLAKESLGRGNKDVAAVLASAALEDALKKYSAANGIDVADKTLAEIINALKAGGHVAGPLKGMLEPMPRLRNAAMHGDWDKITAVDVGGVIGVVEQWLLTKMSGV